MPARPLQLCQDCFPATRNKLRQTPPPPPRNLLATRDPFCGGRFFSGTGMCGFTRCLDPVSTDGALLVWQATDWYWTTAWGLERNSDLVRFLPGDLEAPVPPSCHPWAFSPIRKTSSASPRQLATLLVTEGEGPWKWRAEGWRGLPSLWCPPANTRRASRVLRATSRRLLGWGVGRGPEDGLLLCN